MFKKSIYKIPSLAFLGALMMLSSTSAYSQSTNDNDWDVSLGAGAIYAPTYEGSDDYLLSPIPLVDITYKDRYSLGIDGLTADILENDITTLGVGLVYDGGRDEDGSTLFYDNDDDTLRGMGDIDGALGLKGYASHDFEPVTISGSITQFLGDDNDGLLAKAALSKKIQLNQQTFVTPSISTTWADERYMDTFFGVNSGQAARSQFSQFNAESGFKDISAGVNVLFLVTRP